MFLNLFLIVAVVLMVVGALLPNTNLFLTGLIVGLGSGIAAMFRYLEDK